MNKPLAMVVKETRMKLVDICNKSGLSPIILDLLVQNIYLEVHSLAQKQTFEEENTYIKMIENEANNMELGGDIDEAE